MELTFSAAAKPGIVSEPVKRRHRLVRRIDQQIGFCAAIRTGDMPRASWAWVDDSGGYNTAIKYGRQPIELKKGMFSIDCKDIDGLEQALMAVKAMVLKGDFDDQLAKAAAVIRARFGGG